MSEPGKRYIQIPRSTKYPDGHQLPLKDRVLVVVGANGSGKTRFGVALEKSDPKRCLRVSGLRSLIFPGSADSSDLATAEREFFQIPPVASPFGISRIAPRSDHDPSKAMLDDFGLLLKYLFSEAFAVSEQYRIAMKSQSSYVAPPKTRLETLYEVWRSILPKRRLEMSGSKVRVRTEKSQMTYISNGKPVTRSQSYYRAADMSEGEKSLFYLIGETLCAPKDGILIVDEPELHIHPAIQAKLWDAMETVRPDCTFVYLTHDLNFASSRKNATKIWSQEYTGVSWEWEEIPETDSFPEPILFEIMGTRQPILFVEGERGSLDYFIYTKLFPNETIMPCGSCEAVVSSTKSFEQLVKLHHNKCRGLIDNDGRLDVEIEILKRSKVNVLPVALIENLFMIEPVLRLAAEKLGHAVAPTVSLVKERVLAIVANKRTHIVSNLAQREIEAKLRQMGKLNGDAAAFNAAYMNVFASIDPIEIYARWNAVITKLLVEHDYDTALRYYKIKGLAAEAATPIYGGKFQDQIMRWLQGNDGKEFITAMLTVVPR